MSLEDRKALDEAMRGNPLWELHRRRMLEVDSALGDWRFEDLRDNVRDFLIDSIEGRVPPQRTSIQLEALDTDANQLFSERAPDEKKKFGDLCFEDLRDKTNDALLGTIEQGGELKPVEIAVDTDAQALSSEDDEAEGNMQESGIVDAGYSRVFATDLLSGTPNGMQDNPSMLLEIGGGERPRPYSTTDLQRKNVIIGNVDMSAGWGDKRYECDLNKLPNGLHSTELEQMFSGTSLGSVIMSHTIKFLELQAFERILETAVQKLSIGGCFTVLDINVNTESAAEMKKALIKMGKDELNIHDFVYARTLKAFAVMEKLAASDPENLQFKRYVFGPVFQQSTARKFMGKDSSKLQEAAAYMLTKGAVKLLKHPVTDATAENIHTIGNKLMLPMLAEAVLVIEKIDPEKERKQRRIRNQGQRTESQKKKRLRKQKKKSQR